MKIMKAPLSDIYQKDNTSLNVNMLTFISDLTYPVYTATVLYALSLASIYTPQGCMSVFIMVNSAIILEHGVGIVEKNGTGRKRLWV